MTTAGDWGPQYSFRFRDICLTPGGVEIVPFATCVCRCVAVSKDDISMETFCYRGKASCTGRGRPNR
jgi:hypothetical protein